MRKQTRSRSVENDREYNGAWQGHLFAVVGTKLTEPSDAPGNRLTETSAIVHEALVPVMYVVLQYIWSLGRLPLFVHTLFS